MSKEVSIRIKINDNFKDVTVDAESLGKAIDQVSDSSKELASSFVKFAAISQLAEGVSAAFSQLNQVFSDLSGAYADQSVAETRLAQAMSNTMGATDAEIQSIKDLCSEQQRLGVIGDEVQLAAAQELATYLEYSDSLKAIIPVMNDMAAQQYGLGASAESVTQIATMLGKVMNGQTEALSRYGYKFDEAQKQILQFGTEAERAAVLVDVVGESVGGMNEALAQTAAGKMQQFSNTLGDWKEKLGDAVQNVMPLISGIDALAQTAATITRLTQAFNAMNLATLKAKVESAGLAVAHRTQAAAASLLGISETEAAVATGVLRVKIIALQATMTLGLSVAITAVIDLIVKLTGKSREAADAVEEVDEAYLAYRDTTRDAGAEIRLYTSKLEDLIKHHENDKNMVDELNGKYGEAFGYYSTAESWYNVLINKSEAYCRQLGFEAQAKVYASQVAALQLEKDENDAAARNLAASGGVWRRGLFKNHMTDEAQEIVANSKRINEALAAAQGKFEACTQGMLAAQEELRTGMEDTSEVTSWQTMSLTQLTKAIQTQKGVVEDLAGVDEKQAAAENKILKQMEARKKLLEGRYGLGNGGSEKKDSKKGVLEGIDKEALQEVDDYIKRVDKEIEAYFHHIDEESERTMRDLLKPSQAEQYGVKNLLGIGEGLELELTMRVEGAELAKQNIDTLRRLLSVAKDEEKEKINEAIAYWSKYNVNLDSAKSRGETIEETLGGLGSIMGSLSGIVGEGAAGWLQWASNVFSAISSALPEIAKLVGGNIAQAYAGAIAQSQSVPPPMNYILLGTNLAAVAEAVAKIPKFANGNVAYGATLGIFGEYANAATNPEVTMPADKLRSIIFGSGGAPKEIRLRARGRDLVGSIKVEQLIRSRG